MHPLAGYRRGSLGADATAAGSLAAGATDSAFDLHGALRWFDKAQHGCAAFAYPLVLTPKRGPRRPGRWEASSYAPPYSSMA